MVLGLPTITNHPPGTHHCYRHQPRPPKHQNTNTTSKHTIQTPAAIGHQQTAATTTSVEPYWHTCSTTIFAPNIPSPVKKQVRTIPPETDTCTVKTSGIFKGNFFFEILVRGTFTKQLREGNFYTTNSRQKNSSQVVSNMFLMFTMYFGRRCEKIDLYFFHRRVARNPPTASKSANETAPISFLNPLNPSWDKDQWGDNQLMGLNLNPTQDANRGKRRFCWGLRNLQMKNVILVVMIASWGIDPSEGLLTTKGWLAVGLGKQRGLAKSLPVV